MSANVETPSGSPDDLLFSPAGSASEPNPNSGMSDERNADSVLFKLDKLDDDSAKAESGSPRQMARLAAAAPASGGSGLIDVKALAGASDDDHEASNGSASASDTNMSTSQALLPSNSMLGAPIQSTTPTPAAPSRMPLYILSALTVLALAATIAAVIVRG